MSLKILHLEDNLLDAELVQEFLCEGNFSCDIMRVETRSDFTSAVTEKKFDLILADYSLPSFDGLSALKIARAYQTETPFIIISGALGEELAIETLKNGATDYILKHRLERLGPSVSRALREVEEREARRQAENERTLLLFREQEARHRAEEANLLKDEFLATVSHELRTPLNAIFGWVKMLRGGTLDEDNVERALEIIERNACAQIQLIEDLLDVSRIITGKLRAEIKSVDLSPIVKSAIDSVRPAAQAKSIEIATNFEFTTQMILADGNRLQQIIWNLLSNAVKFTPENGRIEFSLRRDENHVEIKVTDTGEGIEPGFLPFVFDRFRQAEQTTTRKHGGLGLGLSIVKHLIEMHGGTVSAESAGIGFGSIFTVRLPQTFSNLACEDEIGSAHEPEKIICETSDKQVKEANKILAGLSILVVDDDEDALEMMQIMLAQSGAQVALARSAVEALEEYDKHRPDVLISDIGMPEEDGYALISKIRLISNGHGQKTRAIALTGFAREEDRSLAISKGFDAHLTKPIDPSELVRVIANLTKVHTN